VAGNRDHHRAAAGDRSRYMIKAATGRFKDLFTQSFRLCHTTQFSQVGSILFLSRDTFRCCTRRVTRLGEFWPNA
jgi:hypothetical protein